MKNIKHFYISSTKKDFTISNFDPDSVYNKNELDAKEELIQLREKLSKLQYKLYAERTRSVLVILQGMDASGKDGVIRNVMNAFSPIGCRVDSFKVPSTEELSHDFLWRIHKCSPSKGIVGIFNRSHYEDVIEVRVQNIIPKSIWSRRYRQINEFERHLYENNTTILKFFLYVSKGEQKKRLQDRLDDPEEHWKVSLADNDKRKKWNQYMKAYEDAINYCSTSYAPWYIIPADKKWFRNWLVAKILFNKLEQMNPKFPHKDFKDELKIII